LSLTKTNTMANDCSNYIRISGSVKNMKPIYDFFNEGQKKIDLYYTQKKEYVKNNPDKTIWDKIDGIELEEQLVMNTLVPHDKEYEKIKKSGEFLLNPQTVFYGCKWDFHLSSANVLDCTDDLVTYHQPHRGHLQENFVRDCLRSMVLRCTSYIVRGVVTSRGLMSITMVNTSTKNVMNISKDYII